MRSLQSLDRTEAQLKYACAYSEGDVVVPVRDYRRYGLKKKVQYTVISRDIENNQVTVRGPDGSAITLTRRGVREQTYAVQNIAIALGDQLRWTRNDTARGVRNGQLVTVEAVDAKGTATLRDASGETITVDLSGQQYLDYALVSTTYGSQGKTADQVLVAVDKTISKEGLYVAVSRAKAQTRCLLRQIETVQTRRTFRAQSQGDLQAFDLTNADARTRQRRRPARDVRSADQSEYLGDRVGELIAVGHRSAVRRDSRIETGSEPAAGRASGVTPEYVANVRSVVSGIEEYLEAQELEGQAERLEEAADAVVSGAEQLEHTAAVLAGLDREVERK